MFIMDLLQFQQNVESIDVWEILVPILENHFGFIEQLNRDQLSEGIRGDGQPMPDYKWEEYAIFKEKFVPTYNIFPTTDLRYTGSFYDKIKASFNLYGIEIQSLDSKASQLEAKYGSTINDLTDESIEKLIAIIIDEYRESLLKAMMNG